MIVLCCAIYISVVLNIQNYIEFFSSLYILNSLGIRGFVTIFNICFEEKKH